MQRITRADSPFTFLQQRLKYVDTQPDRDWTVFIDNVPQWPLHLVPTEPLSPALLTQYPACDGDVGLIEAICARELRQYGLSLTPDQVLVTNGALHALALLFRALYQPGAVAVCYAPMITSLADNLRATGYQIQLFGRVGGDPDLDEICRSWSPATRLIYINSPNNPTGSVCSPALMRQLTELAHERGVALIVDAVYDSFVFQPGDVPTPLTYTDDWRQLYVVNSVSKNFGAPGLRIGWIVSDASNIIQLAGALERECIAISGGAQQQARQLLTRSNQPLIDLVRAGKAVATRGLALQPALRFQEPQGGTQLFVELPVADVELFADRLLVEYGLVLATTSSYVGIEGAFVRIPLGYPTATIERALALLASGLRQQV